MRDEDWCEHSKMRDLDHKVPKLGRHHGRAVPFPSTVFFAAFAFLGLAMALPKSGSRLTTPPDDKTLLLTCPGAAGTYFNINISGNP